MPSSPAWRNASAIGMAPAIAFTRPSRDSSPTTRYLWSRSDWMYPEACKRPRAMGKSNAVPSLRTCAGARFTVMRLSGNGKPLFAMAALTRSRLSRMDASGNPTVVKVGSPLARSTSTSIIQASTPSKVLLSTLASTAVPFSRLPDPHPLPAEREGHLFLYGLRHCADSRKSSCRCQAHFQRFQGHGHDVAG